MILINRDGTGPQILRNWSDVTDMIGFKPVVNPKEIQLEEILALYSIDPRQPCGLSECRTPHNRGYVVKIGGGYLCNVGNVCGKKEFGVDFEQLIKNYKISVNQYKYRENIQKFQNRIQNYESRLQQLTHGQQGCDWCHDQMHGYMTRRFNQRIITALTNRARQKNNAVAMDVQLTQDEREIANTGILHGAKKVNFRTEMLFNIAGIQAVLDYKKLKPLVHTSLVEEGEKFKALNPAQLKHKDLQEWNNWANRYEKRIHEAESIIEDCIRFLLLSNINNIRKYERYL